MGAKVVLHEVVQVPVDKQLRAIEEMQLQLALARVELLEACGWIQMPNGKWIEQAHYRGDLPDVGVKAEEALAIQSYRMKLAARPPIKAKKTRK